MHRAPALRPDGLARDVARDEAEAPAPAPPARLLALQRAGGNTAVARLLAGAARPARQLQRFEEQEHKAIGDAAMGDVAFRISPLVQLTYGDIVALGDYFHGVKEIEGLIKRPGSGKGTIGEIYYAVWVKVRGEDEKKYMGEFFDETAKEAVVARFYKLAGSNIGHFPNPEEGDPARPPQDKDRRHDKDGAPVGAIATYRDTHVQAITRAVELGAAGRPITEALVFEAFGDHFLTDAFSAGHVRTPRKSVREYWDAKVPGFAERLERWMAEQVSTHLDHAGNQPEQVAPHGFKRTKALEGIKKALAVAGSITFGDLVSGAVHDYDSQRGVVADIDGERVRLVGDGGLFAKDPSTGQWSTPSKAKDTMQAATRAVKAGVDEVREGLLLRAERAEGRCSAGRAQRS